MKTKRAGEKASCTARPILIHGGVSIWFIAVCISCSPFQSSAQTPSTTESPINITTPSAQPTRLTALANGTLDIETPCVQLKETDVGTDYILVFPPEIRYQINHGEMVITESSGEVVRITHGQNVDVGGGEVDSLNQLGSEITSQIPDNCSGRFWFVSSITPK